MNNARLIDYYNRAVSEFNHPDPEKAIFGRAEMTGMKADFDKAGRVGLFGVSEKRARAAGWSDLRNPEENFRAAMDLDISSYNTGDLAEMYIQTAGVTGGQDKKSKFIVMLDEAFGKIQQKIKYEDGQPISISSESEEQNEAPAGNLDGVEGKENIIEETKRQSAFMQNAIVKSEFDNGSLERDVESALNMLRDYVNKSV